MTRYIDVSFNRFKETLIGYGAQNFPSEKWDVLERVFGVSGVRIFVYEHPKFMLNLFGIKNKIDCDMVSNLSNILNTTYLFEHPCGKEFPLHVLVRYINEKL